MKKLTLYGAFLFLLMAASFTMRAQSTEKKEPVVTFTKVEVEPSFPGGKAGWLRFLEQNLHAGVPVDRGANEGTYTVLVQFIVDEEGAISDLKTLTNHGFGMEEEVLRTMRLSPKWVPAVQNGRTVRAYHKQPITFVIAKG